MLRTYLEVYLAERPPQLPHRRGLLPRSPQRGPLPDHPRRRERGRLPGAAELVVGEHPVLEHEVARPPPLPVVDPLVQHPRDRRRLRRRRRRRRRGREDARRRLVVLEVVRGVLERDRRDAAERVHRAPRVDRVGAPLPAQAEDAAAAPRPPPPPPRARPAIEIAAPASAAA